jgi:hypothetical protein
MKYFRFRLWTPALFVVLTLTLLPTLARAQAGTTSSTGSVSETKTKKTTKAGSHAATSSEIASAQASGKVWVNTDTGVYHKSGRWYGKTKTGKFMTESEAKATGYKAAQKE